MGTSTFGELENRVKLGRATLDDLHLWQKKISVGMVLNHWRLAQNGNHPHAPGNFDPRYMVFALDNFRCDFRKFADKQAVPRNGSTLILQTTAPNGWLAHVFGASAYDLGENHDAILPFGMVAITHRNQLLISVFYDSAREFEISRLATEWQAQELDKCSDVFKITAALAVVYSDFLFKARVEAFGISSDKRDELFMEVGYQLGLDIAPSTKEYRRRGSD